MSSALFAASPGGDKVCLPGSACVDWFQRCRLPLSSRSRHSHSKCCIIRADHLNRVSPPQKSTDAELVADLDVLVNDEDSDDTLLL